MLVKPTTDVIAKIKVVGIGGGGGNAVNTMISQYGIEGVEFIIEPGKGLLLLVVVLDLVREHGDKLVQFALCCGHLSRNACMASRPAWARFGLGLRLGHVRGPRLRSEFKVGYGSIGILRDRDRIGQLHNDSPSHGNWRQGHTGL